MKFHMKKPGPEVQLSNTRLMKRAIFILILFSGSWLLLGQTADIVVNTDIDFSASVREADRLYQAGSYDRCIILLEEMQKTFALAKNEKLLALELLAKAYLETDNPGKAEYVVSLLLHNYPHYDLKEKDNPESFNRLVRKFKVHPRFSIGYRNTMNWEKFKQGEIYSVHDGLDYSEPYRKPEYGIMQGFDFRLYGWAELEFDGDISLNCDLTLKWAEFERNIGGPEFNLNFTESDNYIEIPVYLKKYFHPWKNILPYITAGAGWLYMTGATGKVTVNYENSDPSITTGDMGMLDMRNRHTFEWIAGTGIGYKLKNFRLFLDVRYYGGLKSFTNPEKGLNNDILVNDYFYIDNPVRLNQFELGASVSFTFINSVKRIRR